VAEVQLPQLGESVTEGIITAWLVKPGDTVSVDQPIVEISTDKVDTEIPSPVAGTVTELRAEVDQTIAVGQVIAIITESDSAAPTTPAATPTAPDAAPAPAAPAAAPAPAPAPVAAPAATKTAAAAPATRTAATKTATAAPATKPAASATGRGAGSLRSPLIRRLLAAAGIAPATVGASGPGGRISRSDALRAIAAGPGRTGGQAAYVPDFRGERVAVEPLSRIRRAIAASMMRSLDTTAQLTAAVEVDVTAIMHLRAARKDAFRAAHGTALSPLPLIATVVCETLKRHAVLNASIDTEAGTVTYHDYVNLGLAVDTEQGLLVPNLKDAEHLDATAMALAIADIAERTRERRISPDDITGGTFTITNTGSRGTLFDTPILNPPEVAILATCAIERRPVVVDDGISESVAIRWMTYLCLSYDHRLVDGADAARFLSDLKAGLEDTDRVALLLGED